MKTPRRLLFWVLALPPLAVAPDSKGAGVPKSLGAALQDELGQHGSIAILGSYNGLTALSVDGKRRRTLVPGRIFGVRVDNRSDVIWYRTEKTPRTSDLTVIDLRAPMLHPILVISNIDLAEEPEIAYETPDETLFPAEPWNILLLRESGPVLQRKVDDTCAGKRRRGCPKPARISCDSTPKRTKCLSVEPGAVPLLKELAERGAGRSFFLPSDPAPAFQSIPMGDSRCRRCGTARPIPGTPYLAVLTEAHADLCHVVAEVFDPRTRQFVDIEDGSRSPIPFDDLGLAFGDAWIAGTGDAFIQGGILRTFATGRVPWKGPLDGGGFLGGGRWVPAANYECD
jgi:hypothetical protein